MKASQASRCACAIGQRLAESRPLHRRAGEPRDRLTLVRQWHGHSHTVSVREDGFEYDGQRYRSLSMIAKKITGAHWSGPRFFGVRRARAS